MPMTSPNQPPMLWMTVLASSANNRATAIHTAVRVASPTETLPLAASTIVSVTCLMRNGAARPSREVAVAATMTMT
jgi:hypothetical protein